MISGLTREFALSAVLMVAGAVLNAVATLVLLPSKEGAGHEAIFTRYADSGAWVAGHLVQFAGILVGLAGLFVLARALRPEAPPLAALAGAGAVATAATWALAQAVDGVALKQAVDAWVDAPPADEATRLGNAETVLWTVWGVQGFSYAVYGLTLVLLGAAVAVSRRFGAWIGSVAVAAGSLSLAIGIDVAYRGSETEFYKLSSVAYQLLVLVFIEGILIAEVRPRARPSMVPVAVSRVARRRRNVRQPRSTSRTK
jgi:hypothetical protein